MDNYDERMNYSFEPQPEPAAPQHEPQHNEPKKAKGKTGRLIALVVAVALVAGIGGSVLTDVIGKISDRNAETRAAMAEAPAETVEPSTEDATDPSAEPGTTQEYTIEKTPLPTTLKSNDGDKSLTPAEVYAMNVDAVVGIRTTGTTNVWGQITSTSTAGSGFVLTADGYIVTNYHVIKGGESITVAMHNGEEYDATLIGGDETNDIALLKVDAENLQTVTIGNADDLIVGEQVVAIGNPLGELTFSLTTGVVSALNREVTLSSNVTMNLIQTDCAINSGNSGGALFNLYGEVIGITNAKYSSSSSSSEASIDNIGFAIPLNHVKNIVKSIIETGSITKPYIGVTVSSVSSEAQGYGLPTGAAVRSVEADSPAAKAGLEENDIITEVDGTAINSSTELVNYVGEKTPGDELTFKVYRQGEELELTVTIGEKTQSAMPTTTTDDAQQSQQSQGQSQQGGQLFPWGFGFGY